ncbi:hypothetical protein ES702_04949 [subsurface metagenome]
MKRKVILIYYTKETFKNEMLESEIVGLFRKFNFGYIYERKEDFRNNTVTIDIR